MAENQAFIDIAGFNAAATDWAVGVRRALVQRMRELGIDGTGYARRNLRRRLRKSDGLVSSISFRFPRHLVFVQKGVGKGVPISRVGDPAIRRRPKDWYNGVLAAEIDKLGDAIQPYYSDAIVNAARVKIR